MNISSLVVATRPEALARVAQAIADAGPFTLAEPIGYRLPVVLEAIDCDAAEQWYDWLRGIDGVLTVDLTYVTFGEVSHVG